METILCKYCGSDITQKEKVKHKRKGYVCLTCNIKWVLECKRRDDIEDLGLGKIWDRDVYPYWDIQRKAI